ncbi:MAG: hypothetical protein QGM50_02340 [Anaerolineae bacterium]|nr:hypothetical protein [Anaerolineae bacterium]
MEKVEYIDERGRLYSALKEGDNTIILGPPEDLMAELGLDEPLATTLHNILYRRGFITLEDAVRKQQELFGALQEALSVDVQKLTAAFHNLTKEGEIL